MSRVSCEGCGRPAAVCICPQLVSVKPRTKVVVLQHPREEDNAIGTAWMVERCLSAERIVGIELEDDPRYRAAISGSAILLAPGESAIDLHEQPPEGPVTLIVIDGTWSQARKLVRMNPSLAKLPRYAFRPAKPSNYRIRREPAEHCVSTIEATVAALGALEPETDAGQVLAAFDAMVDHQIRIADEQRASRHKMAAIARAAKGPKPPRRLPLSRRSLVVAYAEANAWPRGTEHGPYPQLVHLVAERIETGERFEAFVAPERPLSPGFSFHSRLPEERVLGGESRDAFRARFSAFLREGDRLGVWGSFALDLLRREGLELPPLVDVRTTAIRFLGHRAGDAAQIAASLDCKVDEPWAVGRTGQRHAAAVAVARALSR
ncbi:MAG: DTW domain-containing protein [Polyangiales bacterium]